MNDTPRFRRRVSVGIRKVVTFIAKRVTPRNPAGLPSGVRTLLQAQAALAPHPKFRQRFPVALAAFMTVLTGLVFWSILAQLLTVFSDSRTLMRQIREQQQQIQPKSASPEEQEENERVIMGLHKLEDKAQQERTRLNDKVARLQADLETTQKKEQKLIDEKQAEEEQLEKHKNSLKKLLGRDIEIHRGPPAHYDAGPKPKAPWYGSTPAYYIISGDYYRKYNAWKKAEMACDSFNLLQEVTGVELIKLLGLKESYNKEITAFNQLLEAVEAKVTFLRQKRQQYSDAPATALDDLNKLRKRMANTEFVRTVFWALDIPTFLSCLVMTAVAYSRLFLISERFAPRQLVRSQP